MPTTTLRFYTAESLGPTRSLTPDGFLLCENVPLARTGVLLYADGEVPVDADSDGIIRVTRDEKDVFAPSAIASFAGKPVTNDHPPMKVGPGNWKDYSVGVVLNPRRGDGARFDDDFLYADLLVQDKDAIEDVLAGKREVSAGYDADYEQIRPGEGRQHLIIGNHVALVDKGRCGPRCAIGDKTMARKKMPAWADRIMTAHRTGDSEVLVDELEKVGEMLGDVLSGDEKTVDTTAVKDEKAGGVHIHLSSAKDAEEGEGGGGGGNELLQRIEALERAVAILAHGGEEEKKSEPESKDKKTKDKATKDEDKEDEKEEEKKESKDSKSTKDEDKEDEKDEDKEDEKEEEKKESKDSKSTQDRRAAVGDSTSLQGPWQEIVSRAEFLAPGIKIPTFDAKQPARTTMDTMCQFRRKVLSEALKEDDSRAAVEQIAGGDKPNLTQMTCDAVALLYNGASELMRQANGKQSTDRSSHKSSGNLGTATLVDTIKSINQRNREKYGIPA